MKLIVTIPALDEAPTIADVIREIPRTIDGVDAVEVLVLDDGSRDATVERALEAGADYVISNRLNRGLAATFKRRSTKRSRAAPTSSSTRTPTITTTRRASRS